MDTKFWAGGLCYPYRSKNENLILTKFIYYFLKNSEFDIMNSLVARGSIPALNKIDIDKFKIPIPPLEVQNEIVRILDSFAKLEARRRQYHFYRDKLLSFDTHTVKWVSLGEICEIKRGKRVTKDMLSDDYKFPVYQNSLIPMGNYNESNCNKNTSFIICAGSAGSIGYSKTKFWAADDCYYFICNENLNNRFVYYNLLSQQELILSKVRKASIPRISRLDIANLKIPLPSLEKQKQIVEILDKFDALVNDLSVGLPAEINARKKQYKYYRDKLLSFDEIAS